MQESIVSSPSQKRQVLIVDDEERFRKILGQILEAQNFEVRYAENGLVAKTILALNSYRFDLVISDIRMPEADGVSLLKDVRNHRPELRVILMTGFSEVLEAEEALKLGASEFLAKPFKTKDLLTSIENALRPRSEVVVEEDEFSFCKIHVDEFTSASTLPSDIYIRLGQNKFVKVGRCGSTIQVDRIQIYKEKKVEYFYVHNRDFSKYAGFALRLAKIAVDSTKITRSQKVRLFKHTGEILLNQIFLQDLKKEDVEFSETVISNTLNLIGEEPDLFDLISLLQAQSDSTYSHSVAVSIYSGLIAKKMGWTSQQTLLKISLGGLYHDIGKKELPPSLLTKHRREMTSDEILLYESHAQRGKQILESFAGFPTDVVQIAFQHHENNVGTGYPLGLNQKRIHPLAKIIHIADEFFHLCQKFKAYDEKPWSAALKELWETRGDEIDPLSLRALMEVFGYPVPDPLLKIKSVTGERPA